VPVASGLLAPRHDIEFSLSVLEKVLNAQAPAYNPVQVPPPGRVTSTKYRCASCTGPVPYGSLLFYSLH